MLVAMAAAPLIVLNVEFDDPNLVTRVLDANAPSAGMLKTLHGFRAGIRSLTGMEELVGLEEVDLHQNEIQDVSPLEGLLRLHTLHLGINLITSAESFTEMPALRHLTLFQNEIEDVTPLGSLTGLHALHLRYNVLEDISALAPLTNLRELTFGNNAIADLGCVAGMEHLTLLNGYFNYIEDVRPLVGLSRLQWLYLGYNRIRDIEPLFELPSLRGVHLEGNEALPRSHVEELQRFLKEKWGESLPPPPPEPAADGEEPFIKGSTQVPARVLRQRKARAQRRNS